MYNGNRLIASYEFNDALTTGHLGIIDTCAVPDILVLNNKQCYRRSSEAYHKLSAWIRLTCGMFEEHITKLDGEVLEPDVQKWIQCTSCRRWRTYPAAAHAGLEQQGVFKDDAVWRCEQNSWDPSKARCTAPEDTSVDSDDVAFIESGSAVQSGSTRTDLRRAMDNLVPPTMESLMEPRDWSIFAPQVVEYTFHQSVEPATGNVRVHSTGSLASRPCGTGVQ